MERVALEVFGLAVLASTGWAQVTERVSVDSTGAEGNGGSYPPSLSADGRYAAFQSYATNLVPGDTNGKVDVFVRDRMTGATERVSVDTAGVEGDGDSSDPSISADGRFVAFASVASNLVLGDTNFVEDVFVRDRLAATTERMSVGPAGAQGDDGSSFPSISADGRYVAFVSFASNLVPVDTNGVWDAFVRDRQTGTTERVSVASGGAQADGDTYDVAISADGRYVAFESFATSLVAGDTNGTWDVFVRDRTGGTTERASVGSGGAQGNGDSYDPSISADGRCVAFTSLASNLVPADTNFLLDVFVRDRQSATTERMSVSSIGRQGNGDSFFPSISADGRYVAYESSAFDLVAADTNWVADAFVRDRQTGTTERVSVDSGGTEGNGESSEPSISADGRCVAFESLASDLVAADLNAIWDSFVRERGTSFTNVCDPGVAGVIACPCANPPGGPGAGCDNSSATGGAVLAATGNARLATDSLVFTTSAEKPTATSIVLQGNARIVAGAVFGQGVRCAGGTLKRLYVKTAVGGSITAPDFGAGDPTVSTRSAALGDVIQVGESRWYLVYYRDPTVLGGCPAASTFNATPTGEVVWWP